MTTKLEQAARQALEALSAEIYNEKDWLAKRVEAITALREALANTRSTSEYSEQAERPVEKRPQNCGTGYCSCIECPYEQPVSQEPAIELFLSQSGTITGTGGKVYGLKHGWNKLYAAPVRTKDLTDDEIVAICADLPFDENFDITVARAVIAADREKNK